MEVFRVLCLVVIGTQTVRAWQWWQTTEATTDVSSQYTPIRLVNGYDAYSGRVEVYYRGRWGTICDDNFDRNDLHVVCRMLGMYYGYSSGVIYPNAEYFGPGYGSIIVDDLNCNGYESDISACSSNSWFSNDCSHSEDVGVDCRGTYKRSTGGYHTVTTDSPSTLVRLVGGYQKGRVEVYWNGGWGTVCSDNITSDDVRVICKTLGFYHGYYYGAIVYPNTYGSGSGPILIDDLYCDGSEQDISQCDSRTWGTSNCGHGQDLAIDCEEHGYYGYTTPRPILATFGDYGVSANYKYGMIRLVNGYSTTSGRVEVYYQGRWGTVCDDSFDNDDARVICRMLGYDYGYGYARAFSNAYFGQGSGDILIDDLKCDGYENDIVRCASNNWGSHNCGHNEDAGVDCQAYETTTYFWQTTSPSSSVRLVGGNSWSGRVEIYYHSRWMTVCSSALDHNDIWTICRAVGEFYGYDRGTSSYYSRGTTSSVAYNLDCNGYESTVSQCSIAYSSRGYYCSLDAGVDCRGYYGTTSEYPYWLRSTTNGYYSKRTTWYPYWLWYTTAGHYLEDAMTVSCNAYGWDISIDMGRLWQVYPSAHANEIYLGDNSCVGNDDGYVVHYRQGLRQCFTSQMIRNNVLVYRNQLIYAERDPLHPFLIINYNWTVDVECDVLRNQTSSAHLHHNTGGSSNHQVSGTSNYGVNMSFYSDPNFRYPLPSNSLNVNVGEKVYVKVYTPINDWTIKMRVHSCYTKPTQTASDYRKYYIIQNGCEVNANTHLISQSSHETRFVFQDFEYADNHEGIQIYCDATFCPSSDYSSSCSQTCNPIIRRRNLPSKPDYVDSDGRGTTGDLEGTTEAPLDITELP